MNSGCKNGCNNTTVLVMGKFDLRVGFRFYTRAGYKTETKVTPSLLRSTCQLLQRSTIYFRTNSNFVQKHFSYFYGQQVGLGNWFLYHLDLRFRFYTLKI